MTKKGLIFKLLLSLIVISPLPLGGNRPIAWTSFALIVGGLLIAWALVQDPQPLSQSSRSTPERTWPPTLWAIILLFGLCLAWALLQSWGGLPPDWHHPLWAEASRALTGHSLTTDSTLANSPALTNGIVSLDPARTRTAVMRLLSYGGTFFLAAHLGRERHRARLGLIVLAIASVLYALYGLLIFSQGSDSLLWFDKWSYRGDLTSTFVNRNSYGTYAGIGTLCCIGLFISGMRRFWPTSRQGNPGRSGSLPNWSDRADSLMVGALPFLLGGAVTATALLFSHSRGALLFSLVAIAVLLLLLTLARVVPVGKALLLSALVAIVIIVVTIASGDATLERLIQQGIQDETRNNIYRLTEQAISDGLWGGFGLGAFEPAFHLYQDTSLPKGELIDMAHNVHLELLMDLGLPAFLCLYGSLALILLTCLTGLFRRRRDHLYPALALAVIALTGLHGTVDFSLQMPAIALTTAFILGIGYAQSFNTSDRKRGS